MSMYRGRNPSSFSLGIFFARHVLDGHFFGTL